MSIDIDLGQQKACFFIGGYQPSNEKDSETGKDIVVEKLVESAAHVRFSQVESGIYA